MEPAIGTDSARMIRLSQDEAAFLRRVLDNLSDPGTHQRRTVVLRSPGHRWPAAAPDDYYLETASTIAVSAGVAISAALPVDACG